MVFLTEEPDIDIDVNQDGPSPNIVHSSEEMDAMEMELDYAAEATKPGLSIAPVTMTSEVGEDGQRKVPGIKIIGLSSELKKVMAGEDSKDGSVEEEEDEEEDEDEESKRTRTRTRTRW